MIKLQSETSEPADACWAYSLPLYDRVRNACLELQDRFGLDVNILLFCCWSATRLRVLTTAELRTIEAAVMPFRGDVLEHLRTARRRVTRFGRSPKHDHLRGKIFDAELVAERQAQELIVMSIEPAPEPSRETSARPLACLAVASLRTYLENAGGGEAARPFLADLVSGAFPETGREAIIKALGGANETGAGGEIS